MSEGRGHNFLAIGIVARMIGVHQHTLRNYETWGLVAPRRSPRGTRYYSPDDVEHIRRIREWIEILGLNRAGVEVMLRMQEQLAQHRQRIVELESEVARLRDWIGADDK